MLKKKRTVNVELPMWVLRAFEDIAKDVGCTMEQAVLVVLLLKIKQMKVTR